MPEPVPETMTIHGFDRFGPARVQSVHRVPVPQATADSVLIRVTAVGMNPGDIKVRAGQRQESFPAVFPMAMGREAAGIVLEVGPGGTADIGAQYGADPRTSHAATPGPPRSPQLVPGTRVFGSCTRGIGALGEQTLLTAESATPIPDNLGDVEAACIPVAVGTAWDAMDELQVGDGDIVLVLGAGGGVGVHAIQIAARAGARVIGVAGAAKRDLVERLGAHHVASGDGWEERVRDAARAARVGAGAASIDAGTVPDNAGAASVDALLDCVGGDVLRTGVELLSAPGARGGLSDSGTCGGHTAIRADAPSATGTRGGEEGLMRVRSIADPAGASAAGGSGVTRRRTAEVFCAIADAAARGEIEIVVAEVVPFSEADRAIASVESGHAAGKAVVTVP